MRKEEQIANIRANILKELRDQGLKSKPLSEQAGLSESAIRDLKRKVDNPRVGTIISLADALNVPTSVLLGEMVELVGSIGAGGQVILFPAGPERALVPRPPTKGPGVVAFQAGAGLSPAYHPGDVIYCAPCKDHECDNKEAIVQVKGGPALLRFVKLGLNGRPALLWWHNLPPVEAPEIAEVKPVLFIMRGISGDVWPETSLAS